MKIKPFSGAGGYTTFDNAILDYIMPCCNPNTWKILCVAIRKTRGWSKEEDKISITQFMELAGIKSKPTAWRAVKDAVSKGYLLCDESRMIFRYRLNKELELDIGLENKPVQKINQNRFRNETNTGLDSKPTKEINKEINTITYPESGRYLLDLLEAKRLNKRQAKTLFELEEKYGLEEVRRLIDWATNLGMGVGKTIVSIESALKKSEKRGKGELKREGMGIQL